MDRARGGRGPGGATDTLRARAVISAVGILHKPFIPDIPGLDAFPGPVMHSAQWNSSVDLTGKRVALIGAVLAEHFPKSGGDTNEIPDKLIEL